MNNNTGLHILAAGGYLVVTLEFQFLDNEDESAILLDDSDAEIDSTPILSDTANDSNTWQRSPNGIDTYSQDDWNFRAGTKDGPNG